MSNETELYNDLLGRQRSDFGKATMLGARSIRWSQAHLLSHRQSKLRDLLSWSASNSEFYRERLDGIDVSNFTEADLQMEPVTPPYTQNAGSTTFAAIATSSDVLRT